MTLRDPVLVAVLASVACDCSSREAARPEKRPRSTIDAAAPVGLDAASFMMPDPSIQARIHRIPVPKIADTAPELVATSATGDPDVASAFRTARASGRPQRILVRVGQVNSPDRIEIAATKRDDRTIAVELELRAFEGILGGNLQATAVLDVDVHALSAGAYELVVTTRRLGFQQPEGADRATPRGAETKRWSFTMP